MKINWPRQPSEIGDGETGVVVLPTYAQMVRARREFLTAIPAEDRGVLRNDLSTVCLLSKDSTVHFIVDGDDSLRGLEVDWVAAPLELSLAERHFLHIRTEARGAA